jgi:hypothetical protein
MDESFGRMTLGTLASLGTTLGTQKGPSRSSSKSPVPYNFGDPSTVGTSTSSVGELREDTMIENQDGTEQHPFIVFINLDFPERNREFVVNTVEVVKEEDGFAYQAYMIRTACSHHELEEFSAQVPEEHTFPLWKNRCVLVSGPSLPFWMTDPELFCDNMGFNCSNTKQCLTVYNQSLVDDTDRHYKFWMLVFPPHVHLNNKILASHYAALDQNSAKMDMVKASGIAKSKGNEIYVVGSTEITSSNAKEEPAGTIAFWLIATKDGHKKLASSHKRTPIRKWRFSHAV